MLLAFFRLSEKAVCEASQGDYDFHDYPDSYITNPWHMQNHICRRCGKTFEI